MIYAFDEMASPEQDLGFDQLGRTMWERMRAGRAGISGMEIGGRYTNLALMLSDECPWRTRIVAEGGGSMVLDGPVIKQYYAAMDVLEKLGKNRSGRKYAAERYPRTVLKEAMVNAFVHRDYGSGEPVVIVARSESLTVRSPGGIWRPERPTAEDLGNVRNRGIARLFRTMEGCAFRGNGIEAIRQRYKSTPELPTASFDESSFSIDLPAITSVSRTYESKRDKIASVIGMCRGASAVTIADSTTYSAQYVRRLLKRMQDEGVVFSTGCGNRHMYYLSEPWAEKAGKPIQATLDDQGRVVLPGAAMARTVGQKTV